MDSWNGQAPTDAGLVEPGLAVAEKARKYRGTPFVHQGRSKGLGVDCIGLLVGAAREAGVEIEDVTGYGRDPLGKALIENLDKQLDCVPIEDRRPGDVVAFWIVRPSLPQHVGILTKRGLVHTHAGVGRVVETGVGKVWGKRIHSVWRFRGWQP